MNDRYEVTADEYEEIPKNSWINFYHLFGAEWNILKVITEKNKKGIHEETHYVLTNFLAFLDHYGFDRVVREKIVFNPATIYQDKPPKTL